MSRLFALVSAVWLITSAGCWDFDKFDAPLGTTEGMALRLAADQRVETAGDTSFVTRWGDSSGASHDATADANSRPELIANASNGRPAVRFDGQTQWMTMPPFDVFAGDYTIVVVGHAGDLQEVFLAATFETGSDPPYDHGILVETGNALGEVRIIHRAPPAKAGGFVLTRGNAIRFDENQILVFTKGAALESFINGTSTGPSLPVEGTFTRPPAFAIGRQSTLDPYRYLHGDIAEIRIYSRALSTDERQQLEAALASRWNISL